MHMGFLLGLERRSQRQASPAATRDRAGDGAGRIELVRFFFQDALLLRFFVIVPKYSRLS